MQNKSQNNLCNLSPNQCNLFNKKGQVSHYFISGITPLLAATLIISMIGKDIKAQSKKEGVVPNSTLAACSAILTCSKDYSLNMSLKPDAEFVQEGVYQKNLNIGGKDYEKLHRPYALSSP